VPTSAKQTNETFEDFQIRMFIEMGIDPMTLNEPFLSDNSEGGTAGYVPTPALVAPIEFTMRLEDYRALGGHMESVVPIEHALEVAERRVSPIGGSPWPTEGRNFRWGV